jgi:PAS domain S-box-containing protein
MPAVKDRASLRQRAVTQLTVSTMTAPRRSSASEALAVLHQLASSPATASDALALLHELQVHQVELDLQWDELQAAQSELETALTRQTALVDRAPVGYMTIDADTVLADINSAGASLLGETLQELRGRPLASWLSQSGADTLRALIGCARDGQVTDTCKLRLQTPAGAARTVYAAVSKDNLPDSFLLVLMATPPAGKADAS